MHIKSVPESITRGQYLELVAGVGLDVNDVLSLEFRPTASTPRSMRATTGGRVAVDAGRDEPVKHKVYIPVVG